MDDNTKLNKNVNKIHNIYLNSHIKCKKKIKINKDRQCDRQATDSRRSTYAATYNFDSSFVLFISSHFTPVGVHYEGGNRNQLEIALTKANNNTGYNEYETEVAKGNSGFRSHFTDGKQQMAMNQSIRRSF